MSKTEKKDNGDGDGNLWNEFLRDMTKGGNKNKNVSNKNSLDDSNKNTSSEGHLIIFGSNNCGKTSLVASFKKLENKVESMKKFLMMRYSYVYLSSNDVENDDDHYLLNIWQISEPQHASVLDNVIPIKHMNNICYMIVLDLSKHSNVKNEYDKWIKTIDDTQNRLLKRCKPDVIYNLKRKLYKHTQSYLNPKDMTTQVDNTVGDIIDANNDDTKVDKHGNNNTGEIKDDNDDQYGDADDLLDNKKTVQTKNPEANIGAPIMIVGTKCDNFRKNYTTDADAEGHYEIMCSYLRIWSLKYGCSVFSFSKGQKEQSRRLLSYINHRIFLDTFKRAPNAVVRLSNMQDNFLFIPTGFDNKEIIKAQNPNRDIETKKFEEDFPNKNNKNQYVSDEKTSENDNDNNDNNNLINIPKPSIKSDDDQKFLRTIYFDLNSSMQQQKNTMKTKPKGVQGSSNGNNNHQAVANFFDKLLNKPQ